MEIKGVITADVIGSTRIKAKYRKSLLETIRKVVLELKILSHLRLEFFRGDSLQIVVDNPAEALKIALLLRAGLKSHTPTKGSKQQWDARMSVGIGSIDYVSKKIVVSDGEAFRFSGWEFDELGKKRLAVRTVWQEVNDELKVSTAFADDIVTGWSVLQAQAVYLSILHETPQKEIAEQLAKTVQNISKLLSAGKEALICLYLNRYKQLITMKQEK